MKKVSVLWVLCMLAGIGPMAAGPGESPPCTDGASGIVWSVRVYGTQSGAGSMDGSSWSDAYGADQLQTALATPGLTELWVGAGTYHPTTSADPNNRNAYFNLPDSLHFYGGFAGTETDLSQRDLTVHRTILSGNIGDTSVHTDNSYFLMNISGATYGILLDGLTLAYANNGFGGGALRISGGSRVEIADCHFHDNEA